MKPNLPFYSIKPPSLMAIILTGQASIPMIFKGRINTRARPFSILSKFVNDSTMARLFLNARLWFGWSGILKFSREVASVPMALIFFSDRKSVV